MIVIGIDPGSTITGYGVLERNGKEIRHIDSGIIKPGTGISFPNKLNEIHKALVLLIERHKPDALTIENLFVAKNAHSSLILGHARGVAILAGCQAGLDITEYTPAEVKKAVVGNGRADKMQIQQMVRAILKLPEIACEDASDALAVAICHCNVIGFRDAVAKSQL